jgi:hypothetical protein
MTGDVSGEPTGPNARLWLDGRPLTDDVHIDECEHVGSRYIHSFRARAKFPTSVLVGRASGVPLPGNRGDSYCLERWDGRRFDVGVFTKCTIVGHSPGHEDLILEFSGWAKVAPRPAPTRGAALD